MSRPGTLITSRDDAPPRTSPTDTGVWYVAGLTEKGPTDAAQKITSAQQFADVFGAPVSYSVLPDEVAVYFRDGGNTAYVARVVGAAAVAASLLLSDSSAGTSLKVAAKSVGDWGNSLQVAVVIDGSDFTLNITDANGVLLETSGTLVDQAAAVAWSATSDYVDVTIPSGASALDPAAITATPLTGGTDDRASITDTDKVAALAKFDRAFGPGQVSISGATTLTAQQALLQHAKDYNRFALLDAPDSAVSTDLTAAAAALRALGELARHGMLWGPWAIVPGSVPGTTVRIPYSAIAAAKIAEVDAKGNPNVPAAGDNGVSRVAIDLGASFDDTTRETLNDAGVCIARVLNGQVVSYGFRTLADKSTDPLYWQASNVRLDMAITAEAQAILDSFVFAQLDGTHLTEAHYGGLLSAMLIAYYNVGALYGTTASEAFAVDIDSVNTPETEADGQLQALITLRRSPFAELVELTIVRKSITEAV